MKTCSECKYLTKEHHECSRCDDMYSAFSPMKPKKKAVLVNDGLGNYYRPKKKPGKCDCITEVTQRVPRMVIANGNNQEYAIMEIATFCNTLGLRGYKIDSMMSHMDKNTQDIVAQYYTKKIKKGGE